MMLSWITVIRRETFPQRPSEFFDLVDWLRQLVLVSFFNAAPPCTTQLSSHDNLWRSPPPPPPPPPPRPDQARLCLLVWCRNQPGNFPCPPSPVKVEEDDEQPQQSYHLTPLTSPSHTSYLIPHSDQVLLGDINAGCMIKLMRFILHCGLCTLFLSSKMRQIHKIWLFTALRLFVFFFYYIES